MKTYFWSGLILTLIVGGMTHYFYDNFRTKEVISQSGVRGKCQVVKYRFWYEIKHCTNPSLNKTMVGLNEINHYQVK